MKAAVGLLVTLVALAGVAVVGDRVAVQVAEDAAVRAFEQQADDVTGADLDIVGFPFLTQVAQGELTHVTGSATTASFGGWTVSDLAVDARGVGISPPYAVASGTASGSVPVETFEQALRDQTGISADLGTAGGSLVLSLDLLGLPLTVTGNVRVAGPETLAIDVVSFDTGSGPQPVEDLPDAVAALLTGIEVQLALPDGVALGAVEVPDGAVRITVNGTDVALEDLVAS